MDIKEMTIEELEARKSEIATELDAPEADLDALEAEARSIKEEIEARAAIEAKKNEIRAAVAGGAGQIITKTESKEDRSKMPEKSMKEIVNSREYVDAYAEYVRTGEDAECRALLTEMATGGTVPVPEFVYDIVKTAWENEGITSRVRKEFLPGILKVGFEISGDDAVVHTEGGAAIDPENLVLGVVELKPSMVKKVVQISDEVYDLRGESFLRYVYDELAYRIAKKTADNIVAAIKACGTQSTTTMVGVPVITANSISQATIATALGNLSDEASNPVVIMHKQTWSAFKAAQYAGNFNADIFEGLTPIFNNSLKAFSAASTGDTYAIVGDLGHGVIANYPNGDELVFKFDELTLKKQDLIEVLGRQYVGIGVVAPNAFVKINK